MKLILILLMAGCHRTTSPRANTCGCVGIGSECGPDGRCRQFLPNFKLHVIGEVKP